MQLAPQDLLGETALALNPRALGCGRDSSRARVAARAAPGADELARHFGADVQVAPLGDCAGGASGCVVEFELARGLREDGAPSPAARALASAALARARPLRPPRILGILNVTPDSFSDGGEWLDPARAVERGLALLEEGADALDVGGESSRPGAAPVGLDEERRRVLPVIRALAQRTRASISVDTTKAELAAEALDAGADMVNDVSAGRFDPRMIPLVARRGCAFALMHMQGTPRDMQQAPAYGDVVDEVLDFLRRRASECWRAGIAWERLWIDPGLGFGKTLEHNLQLLARLAELRSLGLPILAGPSRKAFIDHIRREAGAASPSLPRERIGGTAAAVTACVQGGAELLRVHDVRTMAEAARVAWRLAAQ